MARMTKSRGRAPKLPRFGISVVSTDREGSEWMDGISTFDFDYFPLFQNVIEEDDLSSTNLPPFYRLLSNAQANSLSKWAADGNMARELLGLYWPADFNTDGKLKCNRISWNVGNQVRPAQPVYLTHQSNGRPMKSMQIQDLISREPTFKETKKRNEQEERPEKEKRLNKVVLLHDVKESERLVELEYDNDRLRASLKRAESQLEGLRAQMAQVETATKVRSELVTNAIVNYHFSRANLELLAPAIASMVDEAVSADELSELAGGAATLDHRVKVVEEVARRMQIPITISPDVIGEDDDSEEI